MKLTIEGLKGPQADLNGLYQITSNYVGYSPEAIKALCKAIVDRDNAIKAVTDKAVANGWDKDEAYRFLKEHALHYIRFWSWELRDCYSVYYKPPHDARAWGGIYKRAVKEGIIRRGTEERADPTRHATMTKCWEVV